MPSDPPTDHALLALLAAGDQAALGALYRRYAPMVFAVAARVAGEPSADEVVQEVFLTLWQKHQSFDPAKGTLPGWLATVARNRALNERRRQRPGAHVNLDALEPVADEAALPDDAAWHAHRTAALHAALEKLPPPQRRALSLAFLDELPHPEVAAALNAPLGTAKTRIRAGLRGLAPALAALLAALALAVLWRRGESRSLLHERALRMVTASDVTPWRLSATPAAPPAAHGNYRARPGSSVIVLTTSGLPPCPPAQHYAAWARHDGRWTLLGALALDAQGRTLTVSDAPSLTASPQEVLVTLERDPQPAAPHGAPMLRAGYAAPFPVNPGPAVH